MIDKHEHLDEGTIHAWLDGALPPDESRRVESLASDCPECAALVAEARGLVAASSRILSALDTVPGGVIPGASGADQLAVLRAKRRATRRWWQDRRILAAASLVFVAGVTTLVVRSPNRVSAPMGVGSLTDAAQPAATPPSVVSESRLDSQPAPASGNRREAKAASVLPAQPSPVNVAATRTTDSLAEARVTVAEARDRATVVNEATRDSALLRRRTDSMVAEARPPASPDARLRQEGARQAVQQFQADSTRTAAPRAQLGAAPMRLSEIVTTGVGAAADAARPAPPVCFALHASDTRGTAWVPDRVKLFQTMIPVLSDPSWYHAEAIRASRDSLFWRDADSVTVELLRRLEVDSGAVLFTRNGSPVRTRGMGSATPITATRIACP